MLLNPGVVLSGRYEIIEKIGSGGMAVVYRGKDKKLDRYVTIKVLREDFIGDEEFIERFRSEACSAARLSHPNIVRAYDVGDDGDINFIVMEYIHGDTLKKAIKEKAPFDSRSTINVAIQIASALAQAHKSHIVHRDIKPQNILVGTDGVVKVTDFGIARAATASTMTTTANAAGSVHYFSPEQARGGYVDEKSDIYSLGITMFEMITGVLPFQGNNSVTIALKHINDELPDIRQFNPNCSRSLEGIIKKATMKKADERYASIDLLLADLIRARVEVTGNAQPKKEAEHKKDIAEGQEAASAGIRMSRRAAEQLKEEQEKAAIEAQLREAQQKAAVERAAQEKAAQMKREQEKAALLKAVQERVAAEKEAQAAMEVPQETKPADEKELEYIRNYKKPEEEILMSEKSEEETPVRGMVQESLVGFEKYSKKLRLSKEDDYEKEYMATETVKTSKRPEKKRRNPRTEEDYDTEYDRKAERKVVIAAVITALIIIGIISAVGIKFMGGGFGGFTASEGDLEIPMFIGMEYDEALKEAEKLGITLVEEGEDYSSYYDKGCIIYQSVGEGSMIAEGSKIGIKISLGLTSEEMPDVVGKDEKHALEAIIKLVGDVAQIEYVYDKEIEIGKVIEQEPIKGEKINANSRIILKISKGDENSSVIVPNVVGGTEEQARRDLEAVGLVVGNVSYADSDKVAKGKVITQTVSANQEVPSGSVVSLVVSNGAAEKTEMPEPTVPETTPATQPHTDTTQAPPANTVLKTGTKYFTINAPGDASGSVYVRVVKNDVDGAYPVVDEYRDTSEFPYSIPVTGKGSGSVTCYINDIQQWSQNVNFSE